MSTQKVQRKEFTCHFSDLHELRLSKDLEREFAELMNIPVSLLDEHHYHAIAEIILALNSHILKSLLESASRRHLLQSMRETLQRCLMKAK